MRRTRKWSYVEQEAKRLDALGLTPADIAHRIGVNKSTITRWIAKGKLKGKPSVRVAQALESGKSPGEWAMTVRKEIFLDATDDQLVTMGEQALAASLDPSLPVGQRMVCMGRFQSIVRQLKLVARRADEVPETPKREKIEPKRTGTDPRVLMMAVK